MSQMMINLIINALWETIYMVLVSSVIAVIVGVPLGILLATTNKHSIWQNGFINRSVGVLVNAIRSVPFIILLVAIVPLTRLLVGTSIGTTAAIVPLTIAAIPFMARIIETAIVELPSGLIDAALSMGASNRQLITKFLIPEALPAIIDGITVMMINLVGYSAMAGAIGGGGLGEVAINYGYQRFDAMVMLVTVLLLIFLVQIIQTLGEYCAKRLRHRTSKDHQHA